MARATTKAKAKAAPAAKAARGAKGPVTVIVGTRKGAFLLKSDATRRTWTQSAPILLGHVVYHVILDPRDRKTLLMASTTGHMGPDGLPLHGSRPHVEGGDEAARVPEGPRGRDGALRRSRVLADARARERAGRVVRRHVAAGALPLRRRRRHVGGGRGLQRAPDEGHVDGRPEGHDAGRRQDALDPDRPARQASTCTSACRAAASSRAPTTAPTGSRSTRAARRSDPSRRSTATIRTTSSCTP